MAKWSKKMDLEYYEIKEHADDIYESRHCRRKYTLEDTFYSFLGEYEMRDQHTSLERTSIYIAFATLLIDRKKRFDFMVSETKELLKKANIKDIRLELGEENYLIFKKDLEEVKKNMEIG